MVYIQHVLFCVSEHLHPTYSFYVNPFADGSINLNKSKQKTASNTRLKAWNLFELIIRFKIHPTFEPSD